MRTIGTLRGTEAVSLLALLVPLINCVYSIPLQYLPNIPGYVPVYIRYGDEPLEDINPDLAAAFGETSHSAKSLQLDDAIDHVSNSFKDDDLDAFLEESDGKHPYPLQARATESRSFATVDDRRPGRRNPNKPKLLNIYELPNDFETRPRRRYRGRNRGGHRTRNENQGMPALKLSPPSVAEQERLKKMAIEVEKEETKPNGLYAPNSNYPEPPSSGAINGRHKTQNFAVPLKVQVPLNESSIGLPEIPQVDADPSKVSHRHRTVASEKRRKEPPMKEQRPNLPDCNETNENVAHRDETFVKLQRPAEILSNVHKLSPIDLPPDEDKSNKDNKMKEFTEPNDEIAMD